MVAESITVTTVGLGADVDDQLLSLIADFGGGRYHKVPDPESLPKIFTREAEMIAQELGHARVVSHAAGRRRPTSCAASTSPPRRSCHGYVATKMKPSPAQEILVNADHDEPILARWRVGLGWALAWTSDVKARWAVDLARWSGWPQFWGQLVHEHMRQKRRRELT